MSNPSPLLCGRVQKGTRKPGHLRRVAEARGALAEHSGSTVAGGRRSRTGLVYAENREREKGDCNAGCDNEEGLSDVAH